MFYTAILICWSTFDDSAQQVQANIIILRLEGANPTLHDQTSQRCQVIHH